MDLSMHFRCWNIRPLHVYSDVFSPFVGLMIIFFTALCKYFKIVDYSVPFLYWHCLHGATPCDRRLTLQRGKKSNIKVIYDIRYTNIENWDVSSKRRRCKPNSSQLSNGLWYLQFLLGIQQIFLLTDSINSMRGWRIFSWSCRFQGRSRKLFNVNFISLNFPGRGGVSWPPPLSTPIHAWAQCNINNNAFCTLRSIIAYQLLLTEFLNCLQLVYYWFYMFSM